MLSALDLISSFGDGSRFKPFRGLPTTTKVKTSNGVLKKHILNEHPQPEDRIIDRIHSPELCRYLE